MNIALQWFPAERAAWAPPENITVSEWAERYRVLPQQAAIPGPWNNTLGPYAVGVMDAFNDPLVERITIMASVQSMKTESVYNMLGWAISQDPAPALVVMPTLETLKKVNKRIRELILGSPDLEKHVTGKQDDLKQKLIELDRMEINFATAGSDADLQNVAARYIIQDETDLYPESPEGGSTQEKAVDRSTTYWNRKVLELSRPTVQDGYITRQYERSDRRKYWVPCPHCGGYQVLSFWQVKHQGEKLKEWPKDKRDPEYIKLNRVARYECIHCQEEIDDKDKPGMLAQGKWVPGKWLPWEEENRPFAPEIDIEEQPTAVSHVGFWWNALYSPFRNFSEIAAKFFETKDDPEKYQVFVTQWLAKPWQDRVLQRPASAILQLCTNRPPLIVPDDALALTAGVDSQRRGFWVVIRAWVLTREGLRESHRVRHGFVASFGELEQWLFQDVYRTESGIEHRVWSGLIDTGGGLMGEGEATLTEQVYNWLRRSGRGRIFGSKGNSKPLISGRLAVRSIIDCYPSGKPIQGGLTLWRLDTNALKDFIWARIENGLFHLDADMDETYAAHLAAEVKERNRKGKLVWTLKHGRDNHLLDCEVMAAGAAEAFSVWLLPRPQLPSTVAARPDAQINPVTEQPRGQYWR